MAVLAIGEPAPKERTSTNKALSKVVFDEKYGKNGKNKFFFSPS